jgi:hypothetical protein
MGDSYHDLREPAAKIVAGRILDAHSMASEYVASTNAPGLPGLTLQWRDQSS